MYAYIRGTLTDVEEDSVIVEAGGIGYRIYMPMGRVGSSLQTGEECKVYTYLLVREDALQLFGFLTKEDLRVFKLLIGVSGIGPKGAIAILSAMTTDDFKFAVLGEDAKKITMAPGIGAKTAKRIIIELKDKFDLSDTFEHSLAEGQNTQAAPAAGVKNDVILALNALGYSTSEILSALRNVEITEDSDVETVLKETLKYLSL